MNVTVTVTVRVDDIDSESCSPSCAYKSTKVARLKPLAGTCTLFGAPIEYADQDDDQNYETRRCAGCLGAELRTEGKG